jgi:hypothetical protein
MVWLSNYCCLATFTFSFFFLFTPLLLDRLDCLVPLLFGAKLPPFYHNIMVPTARAWLFEASPGNATL